MRRSVFLVLVSIAPCLAAGAILAQDAPRLRGPDPFTRETSAPPMQRQVTDDVRVSRNYPDQPPVIPHSIEGYAMDLNANKCMSCHARKFTEQSQAPMISVTHYQDRAGNTLGGLTSYAIGRLLPNRLQGSVVTALQRYGHWALLLSWLPIAGDGLAVGAGWLRLNPWLSAVALAAGKFARYVAVGVGWASIERLLG